MPPRSFQTLEEADLVAEGGAIGSARHADNNGSSEAGEDVMRFELDAFMEPTPTVRFIIALLIGRSALPMSGIGCWLCECPFEKDSTPRWHPAWAGRGS